MEYFDTPDWITHSWEKKEGYKRSDFPDSMWVSKRKYDHVPYPTKITHKGGSDYIACHVYIEHMGRHPCHREKSIGLEGYEKILYHIDSNNLELVHLPNLKLARDNANFRYCPVNVNLPFEKTQYNTFNILSNCKYFICSESGFAHLALCMGVPTIVYFNRNSDWQGWTVNPNEWYNKGKCVHIDSLDKIDAAVAQLARAADL